MRGSLRAHLADGRLSPEKPLWRDAEEFLGFVDAAGMGSRIHRDRLRLTGFDLQRFGSAAFLNLAAAARLIIAAECSAFLNGVDASRSEQWGPYIRWARGLGPNNTIITFNYDLIPETLASLGSKLFVMEPSNLPTTDSAQVLKVHGSVNWVRNGAPLSAFPINDKCSYLDLELERVMATPGPTKASTVREHLNGVWAAAERAIREAGTVVFIGYRFPPSDAESRNRITLALIQNESPYLSIHTVLGPRPTEDSTRLTWLLTQAVRRGNRAEFVPTREIQRPDTSRGDRSFNIVPHPAWAEDFLDASAVGHMMEAWRFLPGGRGV
ncbi:hypothetical protein [Anaeromyxobacter oryzisoli]|uniref:hypothetical protein n=1 Tax=Anaeromyxobacter oryzisoli TaxID=2925408 RepID=UPI001F56DFC6|nr:hypothetical protein [Anaeromyxobacter sp. SG63]